MISKPEILRCLERMEKLSRWGVFKENEEIFSTGEKARQIEEKIERESVNLTHMFRSLRARLLSTVFPALYHRIIDASLVNIVFGMSGRHIGKRCQRRKRAGRNLRLDLESLRVRIMGDKIDGYAVDGKKKKMGKETYENKRPTEKRTFSDGGST